MCRVVVIRDGGVSVSIRGGLGMGGCGWGCSSRSGAV